MLEHLIKIMVRRMSFFLLILMSFTVSLMIFGIVGQVGQLVDENVEYAFTHYRPQAVYSLDFDFERNLTPSAVHFEAVNVMEALEKELTKENLSTGFLVALPVAYIKPLQIKGHTVYFQAYFFRDIGDVEEFGFRFDPPGNNFILLSYNLSGDLTPETVSEYFFGENAPLVKAYGVFMEYPLGHLSNVEYVQVAVPLTNKTLAEYFRWLNRDLLDSSGLKVNLYVALNIKNPVRDPYVIESFVTSKLPRSMVAGVTNFYTMKYGNEGVKFYIMNSINGSHLVYFNGTWIDPKRDEEYLIRVINRNQGIRLVSFGVSLSQADIVDLVKDAGTQTVRFFGKYAGLLVVIYLPFFLLVLYSSSTVFRDLRNDLEVLELRGIQRNVKVFQEFFIFLMAGLASTAAYTFLIVLSDYSLSPITFVGVVGLVYLAMLVGRRGDTWRLGRGSMLSLAAFLAAFLILGYMRVNGLVLLSRGYEALMLLFSLLMALIPILGIFVGYLFHRACGNLIRLLERIFDVRYYLRALEGYSYVLTFSVYSLGLYLLPKIVSIDRVVNAILENNGYSAMVEYSDVTSLGLLAAYLDKLSRGFGVMGLLAISLIFIVALRKYQSVRGYSALRGGDLTAVRKSFLKFLFLKIGLVTVMSIAVALFLAVFLDAYIGLTYTSGKLLVESGKLALKFLFKPPHVLIWG
ncbi:hypothetical protein [Thermococcus zilligii]|uniref:hypothetical protein n=1 Tax=Thermococcus zilligii TaxID=54076 RepID=UPI00029B122E|nr:hypothetical protein [Thermococcus zilligii]